MLNGLRNTITTDTLWKFLAEFEQSVGCLDRMFILAVRCSALIMLLETHAIRADSLAGGGASPSPMFLTFRKWFYPTDRNLLFGRGAVQL